MSSTGTCHSSGRPIRLRAKFRAKGEQVKPLLVLFEQEQCSSCDELHLDIFRRKETRELLDRFDVAPIDMWSGKPLVTPKGLFTTVGEWAKALGTSISIYGPNSCAGISITSGQVRGPTGTLAALNLARPSMATG